MSDIAYHPKGYIETDKIRPNFTHSAIPNEPWLKSYFGSLSMTYNKPFMFADFFGIAEIICKSEKPYGIDFFAKPPIIIHGRLECGLGTIEISRREWWSFLVLKPKQKGGCDYVYKGLPNIPTEKP